MRAVELDFLQSARRATGGGLVLLAVGVAAAVVVLFYQAELRGEVQGLDAQAGKLERKAHGVVPLGVHMDELGRQEVLRANEVIDQLGLPWERLFHAIEAAATERVALLGIAPDAKAGTVQISAEALDAQAMFEYLGRLAEQGELSRVYLLQHQLERAAPWPLRFTVVVSWIRQPD